MAPIFWGPSAAGQALAEWDLPSLIDHARAHRHAVAGLLGKNPERTMAMLSEAPPVAAARLWRRVSDALPSPLRRRLLLMLARNLQREAKTLYQIGVRQRREERRAYRPGDDWDAEATLQEVLAAGHPRPTYQHIRARHRPRRSRSWLLLADSSRSLEPVVELLTLGVGLLLQGVQSDHLGLVFFNEGVEVVQRPGQALDPQTLLARALSLGCTGATDLAYALETARKLLATIPQAADTRCILLSDCVPTLGGDPVPAAASLPRLDILHLSPAGIYGASFVNRFQALPRVRVHPIRQSTDVVDAILTILNEVPAGR